MIGDGHGDIKIDRQSLSFVSLLLRGSSPTFGIALVKMLEESGALLLVKLREYPAGNPLSKMSSIVTLSLDRAVDFWRQLITIYLRNAIRSLSANTLIGTEVNKHGAEGLPPKVVIDLDLVIERIPMRLDPYSNELAH